jgi:uncharacterized protein (DUF983 family)
MLRGYLEVRETCVVCDQPLHHHRAKERPACLAILIVAIVGLPVLAWIHAAWRPDPMVLATFMTVGATALALYLLPRLKGIVVAFQWAKRMHGF